MGILATAGGGNKVYFACQSPVVTTERSYYMATEKIGIYRTWLEAPPRENGAKIPRSRWPKERRHSWTVRWFGTTGKRYSKSFKTKKDAEQFARKLQEDVNRGRADKPAAIPLGDFIREHQKVMRGQVAYATLVDQVRALRIFEKFIGSSTMLTNIHPRQAEAFVAKRLSSGISVATVNKDITTLKRVFNLAIEPRGYIREDQNPFAKIKRRKKTPKALRYVTVEEYNRLFKAADDLWWQGVIAVAYGSGLRREEIFNLTWADIDIANKQIKVTAKETTPETVEWEPKDHEIRVVPMSSQVRQILDDIRLLCPAGHSYPFIAPARMKLIHKRVRAGTWNSVCQSHNNVTRDFRVLLKRAGVPKCTLHDLRRSAITNWAQYLPIQVVQQLAGHSNITTTRKYYLMVRDEDMVAASDVMDKILQRASVD